MAKIIVQNTPITVLNLEEYLLPTWLLCSSLTSFFHNDTEGIGTIYPFGCTQYKRR